MKKSFKLLALFLAITLCLLSFVGCGDNDNTSSVFDNPKSNNNNLTSSDISSSNNNTSEINSAINSNTSSQNNHNQTASSNKEKTETDMPIDTRKDINDIYALIELLLYTFEYNKLEVNASDLKDNTISYFSCYAPFYNTSDKSHRYDINNLKIEEKDVKLTNSDGKPYTFKTQVVPLDVYQKIAYEVFGRKDFLYNQENYNKDLNAFVNIPMGLTRNYEALNIKLTEENNLITATIDVVLGTSEGEAKVKNVGQYNFYFKRINENKNQFIRFLYSKKQS